MYPGQSLHCKGLVSEKNCGNAFAVKGNTEFCIKRVDKGQMTTVKCYEVDVSIARPTSQRMDLPFSQSSLQMTVDNNYAIAIAMLSYWLVNLLPIFQPMRSKIKTDLTL